MATASPLLSLPPELRNRIYNFYFSYDPLTAPQTVSRSYLALPTSCRQLYDETYTLAFAATTFVSTSWQLPNLQHKLQAVHPELRPLIKRLDISVAITEFITQRCSLNGLELARAGLGGLEELFITFNKRPTSNWKEKYIISNLEIVLCKTIARCGNERLRKIRIVHDGYIRLHDIRSLEDGVQKVLLRSPHLPDYMYEKWQTVQNFDKGQFSFVRKPRPGDEGKEISILFGSSIYEAEKYQEHQKELLESRRQILTRALEGDRSLELSDDINPEAIIYELNRLAM